MLTKRVIIPKNVCFSMAKGRFAKFIKFKPDKIMVTWLLLLAVFLFIMGTSITNSVLKSLSISFGMVGLTAAMMLMFYFVKDWL